MDLLRNNTIRKGVLLLTWLAIGLGLTHGGARAAEGETSLYVEFPKPVIVNVFTREAVHFVRVTVQLKLTDPSYAPQVRYHLAPLEHSLIQVLSDREYYEFQTVAGKRKVREDSLAAVRKAAKEAIGESVIDSLLFTSLIVQ